MRLVGASNNFIRGPFVVEGVIYGIVAGILSFLIFIPLIGFLSPYIAKFVPEVDLNAYFNAHLIGLLFYQFLFGVGLGIISSVVAIRKYLHV